MGWAMIRGITDAQRRTLEILAPALEPRTYLAGGVAVALAIGHRLSLDLDLFVPADFDPDRLAERLSGIPSVRVVGRARGTLHLEDSETPVSILSYRYPLLATPRAIADLPVAIAGVEDLACMKVSAIAGRGAAKDFWDLHELLASGVGGGSLQGVLDLYVKKFPTEDIGHAVRSLAYFGEADAAVLPAGLSVENWTDIKSSFAQRVRDLWY
jgi:hypothetical protein